jgi:hypothetical protein
MQSVYRMAMMAVAAVLVNGCNETVPGGVSSSAAKVEAIASTL